MPTMFLPRPMQEGSDQLLQMNSVLWNSEFSFPGSEILDFSEFSVQSWSGQIGSYSGEYGVPHSLKWSSEEGSTLTSYLSVSGDPSRDFSTANSMTFKSRNGDKLSISQNAQIRYDNPSDPDNDAQSYKISVSVSGKYAGDSSTRADDVTYTAAITEGGWDSGDGQGNDYGLYTISFASSAHLLKASVSRTGSWNYTDESWSDTSILKFSTYSFQDLDNGFSLSFTGTWIRRSDASMDGSQKELDLKKISVSTADYKCSTAFLHTVENDMLFDLTEPGNFAQITSAYHASLESVIMKGQNNIEIKSPGGAAINAGNLNDKVKGGSGEDQIAGGAGKDTLSGGAGSDVFIFGSEALSAANRDTITDFKVGEDQIGLHTSIFSMMPVDDISPANFRIIAAGVTIGNAKTSAAAGGTASDNTHLMLAYGTGSSILYFDPDAGGSQAAVAIATLTGVIAPATGAVSMSNTDFVLIF